MLKFRGSYADVKGALTKSKVGPAWSEMGAVNPSGYGTGFLTSYDGPSYTNQTIYTTAATYNNQASASLSNTIANENLKPFSVTSYEAGADINLFSNRLGLDVTYFTTINGPQIYQWDVAPSTGFDSKMVNGVTTQKNGWELTLTANPI
jgi:outer membrane receptor protein involved in Fe transport